MQFANRMEYWCIAFWPEAGISWVEKDLLQKMRRKDPYTHAQLRIQMDQYASTRVERVQAREELVPVQGEERMWNLKFHLREREVRFLGYLSMHGTPTTFYALHGFNLGANEAIPHRHKRVARERIQAFINWHYQYGLQKIL